LHEYVHADRILQSVLEEIRSSGKTPQRVKVDVGDLLGLTRKWLTMAYGFFWKGTKEGGSRLTVRLTKGSVECGKCGFAGRLQARPHDHSVDPAFACPRCGSSLRVVEGLEVKITGIE